MQQFVSFRALRFRDYEGTTVEKKYYPILISFFEIRASTPLAEAKKETAG